MLNTYDNFALNSIFWPKAFIKKNMHFSINYIVSVPPFKQIQNGGTETM